MGSAQGRQLKSRLQDIDSYEFEEVVAELWRAQGWEAHVTQEAQDMGVDVLASKQDGPIEQRLAIQVKRYSASNPVGQPEVKEYYALRDQEGVDAVVIVTSSRFTSGAKEWADDHNLKLVDGDDLVDLVEDLGRHDLVDQYAPRESKTTEKETTTTERDRGERPTVIEDLKAGDNVVDMAKGVMWATAWAPKNYVPLIGGGTLAVGILLLQVLVKDWTVSIPVGLFTAGPVGLVLALGFWTGGAYIINKHWKDIYGYYADQIEDKTLERLGMTGGQASTYTLREGEGSPPGVKPARKYSIVSVAVGPSSFGIVEDGYVRMDLFKYASGEKSQEFYYDQITSLDYSGGELKVGLSDGSEHTWPSEDAPEQAVDELRDRVRKYKR